MSTIQEMEDNWRREKRIRPVDYNKSRAIFAIVFAVVGLVSFILGMATELEFLLATAFFTTMIALLCVSIVARDHKNHIMLLRGELSASLGREVRLKADPYRVGMVDEKLGGYVTRSGQVGDSGEGHR